MPGALLVLRRVVGYHADGLAGRFDLPAVRPCDLRARAPHPEDMADSSHRRNTRLMIETLLGSVQRTVVRAISRAGVSVAEARRRPRPSQILRRLEKRSGSSYDDHRGERALEAGEQSAAMAATATGLATQAADYAVAFELYMIAAAVAAQELAEKATDASRPHGHVEAGTEPS